MTALVGSEYNSYDSFDLHLTMYTVAAIEVHVQISTNSNATTGGTGETRPRHPFLGTRPPLQARAIPQSLWVGPPNFKNVVAPLSTNNNITSRFMLYSIVAFIYVMNISYN
jgi:hypothetical protein